ncbi:MAG: ABC transporter ATP-binding protein, partial [Anaerolineae bacterium]|nr:ABC transporter ATP-binding protein [Anaerolineae bacterium]
MRKGKSSLSSKREFTVAHEYHYDRRGTIRWLNSHLWRYKLYLIGFGVTIAASNALFSATPRLVGLAFDEVLQANPEAARLGRVAMTILAVVIAQGLVYLLANLSAELLGQRLARDAREELYLSLLGKSQTFHNRQRVGDIMARATEDVRQLTMMISPGAFLIADASMSLLMPILFIGFIEAELLLVPLIYIAIFFVALRRYTRRLNPIAGQMRWQFGVMNAGLTEAVSGIEVVKAAAQEQQESRKFFYSARLYRDFFVKEGQVQARYLPVLFLGVALAVAFMHALLLFSQGRLTVGEFVAFMGLLGLLRFPTFISIFTFSLVQLGLAGAQRILSLMQEETDLDENETGYSAPMRGEIMFDQVTFGYNGSPILKNISFTAEPGQTVAIVGQTGSGKSSLTQLVNRTYDVQAGQVLIDGRDVREWNLASLRSQISTIEQDVFLFSRTVAENIGFGLGQQSDAATIEAAAHQAQAHDF